jgi:hypothetical protein
MSGVVGEYSSLPINVLLLDKENPRFQSGPNLLTQIELANKLVMAYDVYQIAKNIAKNGYFAPSPMVVVKNEINDGSYIVVEGNRRLTALKALSEPKFRSELYDPEQWNGLAAESTFDVSTKIPVVIVERDQVELLLGYRHISGDLPWQPLAQARWVAKVIDQLNYTFEAAANTSGKSKSDIIAMYRNQGIAKQAENLGFPSEELENNFSLITVAMTSPGLREFVKAPANNAVEVGADPIPVERVDNLRELLTWLYGDPEKDLEPVVPESRQIGKLGNIVQSPAGLDCLRKTWDLAEAEAATKEKGVDPLTRLKSRLNAAKSAANLALEDLADHSDVNEVIDAVEELQAVVVLLGETISNESD